MAYAGTVRCTYGMVQLHMSGRYNIRRNVTKSEGYKNWTVHDFAYDVMQSVRCSDACGAEFRAPARCSEVHSAHLAVRRSYPRG